MWQQKRGGARVYARLASQAATWSFCVLRPQGAWPAQSAPSAQVAPTTRTVATRTVATPRPCQCYFPAPFRGSARLQGVAFENSRKEEHCVRMAQKEKVVRPLPSRHAGGDFRRVNAVRPTAQRALRRGAERQRTGTAQQLNDEEVRAKLLPNEFREHMHDDAAFGKWPRAEYSQVALAGGANKSKAQRDDSAELLQRFKQREVDRGGRL